MLPTVATGVAHSVREFIHEAASCVGIDIVWHGTGVDEKGYDAATGKQIIGIDPVYFRRTEVPHLLGDAHKAYEELGWKPQVSFKELVELMMKHDCAQVEKELSLAAFRKKTGTVLHEYR